MPYVWFIFPTFIIQIFPNTTRGFRFTSRHGWPSGWLAGRHTDVAPKHSLCYFSSVSKYMIRCIDIHLQSGDVSVYWLWLLLNVSAVQVVIVTIAICDIPRQEFSLCERVYIHNTYMKNRKSCSETQCKFRVKFPGQPVSNPSTIRKQTKRFTNI